MTRRRVAPWLGSSLIVAVAAFLTFCGGIDPGLAGWARTPHAAFLFLAISFALSAIWVLTFVAALIVLRWRGLWLLLGVLGASIGPVFFVATAQSMSRCMSGAEPSLPLNCFP
jgi:hypothetical protein